jgi:4-hydroxymandelate oxidase
VAGGDLDRDHRAWQDIDVVPRVLQGLTAIDSSLLLGGIPLATPIMVAATASHRLAHPDGEIATARAAARAGALMVYSSSAAIEVTEFGAAATTPWWAQVYVMKDRALSDDYLIRAAAAGAGAIVVTVDNAGTWGDAPFRSTTRDRMTARPGNFPGLTWAQMSALIEPGLDPSIIGQIASATGLPVHVKGIMHPDDAVVALEAGAAAIVVSNHGRRQVPGVAPTAVMLAEVVAAVDGRVPVTVDGGLRSGVDVLRALALGASAVGIGRPVLWGLAVRGEQGVVDVLSGLTAELRQAMAGVGAGALSAIGRSMVRPGNGR